MFGVEEALNDVVVEKGLHWAGHMAHMENPQRPKNLLFGWLLQKRLAHGTELTMVEGHSEKSHFGIKEGSWFYVCGTRYVG